VTLGSDDAPSPTVRTEILFSEPEPIASVVRKKKELTIEELSNLAPQQSEIQLEEKI